MLYSRESGRKFIDWDAVGLQSLAASADYISVTYLEALVSSLDRSHRAATTIIRALKVA